MTDFAVLRTPSQVLFGAGMAAAAGRVAAGHGRRVLVITDPVIAETPGFAHRARVAVAGLEVAVFKRRRRRRAALGGRRRGGAGRVHAPDVIVAVGGGSVIDLAKVTALLLAHGGALEDYYAVQSVPGPGVPLIALPTTAGTGSEATPVSVITDPATEMKIGVASPHLIPRHAICDPLLTLGAPPVVTAHAGIDALSHAIEAYMAAREEPSPELVLGRPQVGKNLLSDTLALTAAGHIVAQPRARRRGRLGPRGAQRDALRRAAGRDRVRQLRRLGRARAAVRRRRATHTSHGLGTGLLLPYVMEFNRPVRDAELAELASVMGGDAVECVHALGLRIGLPASLAGSASPRPTCAPMAEASIAIKRLIDNNPRPLDTDALEASSPPPGTASRRGWRAGRDRLKRSRPYGFR